MNLAVVGSRTFSDRLLIQLAIQRMMELHPGNLTIVSGGARGADSIAGQVAARFNLPTITHLPMWDQFGKSAGFKRNALIVADADEVLAFFSPGPRSAGTQNTVDQARRDRKIVHVYHEGWRS